MLFVYEFLTQDALFVVQIEEHTQVFSQFVILLCFNDPLDFSLLCNLLFGCVYFDACLLVLLC
mgnify:CR=1 FL=1